MVGDAKKFTLFKIYTDPDTKYRYATEILSMQESKLILPKSHGIALVVPRLSIKDDPIKSLRPILDEIERSLNQIRQEKLEKEGHASQQLDDLASQGSFGGGSDGKSSNSQSDSHSGYDQ